MNNKKSARGADSRSDKEWEDMHSLCQCGHGKANHDSILLGCTFCKCKKYNSPVRFDESPKRSEHVETTPQDSHSPQNKTEARRMVSSSHSTSPPLADTPLESDKPADTNNLTEDVTHIVHKAFGVNQASSDDYSDTATVSFNSKQIKKIREEAKKQAYAEVFKELDNETPYKEYQCICCNTWFLKLEEMKKKFMESEK